MIKDSKLQQDRDAALVNDSPLEITEGDQGFVEASQDYTFKPRPELDNQNLYCVYIQVNGCHQMETLCLNSHQSGGW